MASRQGQRNERAKERPRDDEGTPRVRRSQQLLLAGVACPLIFASAFLAVGAFMPGYSPVRHGISQLTAGRLGPLYRVTFATCGVLMLILAVGVRRTMGRTASRWASTSIVVIGVAMIAAGIFPTDPANDYPRGVPDRFTVVGRIHGLAGLTLGVALVTACLVFRPGLAAKNARRWVRASRAVATLVAVSGVAAGVVFRLDQTGSIEEGVAGLLQRVGFTIGVSWLGVVAARHMGSSSSNG